MTTNEITATCHVPRSRTDLFLLAGHYYGEQLKPQDVQAGLRFNFDMLGRPMPALGARPPSVVGGAAKRQRGGGGGGGAAAAFASAAASDPAVCSPAAEAAAAAEQAAAAPPPPPAAAAAPPIRLAGAGITVGIGALGGEAASALIGSISRPNVKRNRPATQGPARGRWAADHAVPLTASPVEALGLKPMPQKVTMLMLLLVLTLVLLLVLTLSVATEAAEEGRGAGEQPGEAGATSLLHCPATCHAHGHASHSVVD